jgi:hypothetical protein
LPGGLARRIDVKDQIATTLAIEDAANGFRCPALGERLLLEERAEGFQTRTIDIGQEATQTGAMRKTSASKERHEGCLERLYALKEVGQGPFPTDGIADQQCEKIDGLIAAEAPSHQANLLRKSLEQPLRRQVMGNDDDFGEPRRHRRTIKR